jgi:hypothetical protein
MSAWRHRSYSAVTNEAGGKTIIAHDPDGSRRTVAFIDGLKHWDAFCAAIDAGMTEVDAVYAVVGDLSLTEPQVDPT